VYGASLPVGLWGLCEETAGDRAGHGHSSQLLRKSQLSLSVVLEAALMFCCSLSTEEPPTAEPSVTPVLHNPEMSSAEQLSSALSLCQIKAGALG